MPAATQQTKILECLKMVLVPEAKSLAFGNLCSADTTTLLKVIWQF